MPEEMRNKRATVIYRVAFMAGILIALFGIGVDYILPAASPGLNIVQLLIIGAGFAISLIAWQLRHPEARRRVFGAKNRSIAVALVITLMTFVVLEVVLTVSRIPTYFPTSSPELVISPRRWIVCDEPGCHYDYDELQQDCENGQISGHICMVNRQGFPDSQDFVAPDEYSDRLRVLVLGDSFTFGESAEFGKSYVNFMESQFPDIEIWNTGVSGIGTNQAIETFKWFAPQLRPQLTILGFYMNDFSDNLFPIDSKLLVVSPEGRQLLIRSAWYDMWGNTYSYDLQTTLYYGDATRAPRNRFEHALGITRLGTLALRLRDALGQRVGALQAKQIKVTREYLAELRDLTRAHNSALLVLVISPSEDLDVPSDLYLAALDLLEELGIPYLNPAHLLDASNDYAIPPDPHWNTAGHQKVGAYLSDCVAVFSESDSLSDCAGVVTANNAGV